MHQKRIIIRSSQKLEGKCSLDKKYIESFSRKGKNIWKRKRKKKRKKKRNEKEKKKKKRKKKDILKSSPRREYNKCFLMKKKRKGTSYKKLMEDDLSWLQHLFDDPRLNIKPQNNFWALISFLHNPFHPWPCYKPNKDHIDCWIIATIFIRINLVWAHFKFSCNDVVVN